MSGFHWTPIADRVPAWLPARTVLLVRHGSHAYGTSLPGSDHDVKGACVPPRPVLHGFATGFDQVDLHEPDVTVFDVRKFFRLAAEGNPTLLETLFVDDADVLFATPAGEQLRGARDRFLSRKVAQTFAGYAASQLKRIETHRRWLLHPLTAPPTRAEFGLPDRPTLTRDQLGAVEAEVKRVLDTFTPDLEEAEPAARARLTEKLDAVLQALHLAAAEDRFALAARRIGLADELLDLASRERRYRSRLAEWHQFETWKRERNPARAALEAAHGYDTKHAMHLVRLLRMAAETITNGRLQVRRPDAAELLEIRRGALGYDTLLAQARTLLADVKAAVDRSPLPPDVDRDALDALCVTIVESVD